MNIKYFQNKISKDEFFNKYVNIDKFREMCKSCPYYGKNYSCSGEYMDREKSYENYKNVSLYLMKVELDDYEKVESVEEDYLNPCKDRFINMLYLEEKKVPRGKFINPGPCRLCKICAKEENKSCRHIDKLRFSASAMGVDATKICKEIFSIDILWKKGEKIPPYYCFLGVLLYN